MKCSLVGLENIQRMQRSLFAEPIQYIFNADEVEVIIPLIEVATTKSLILTEVTSRDND